MKDHHGGLDHAWVDAICEQFNIGAWTGEWERLGGAFNENIKLVTDRGAYVVKISGQAKSGESNRGEPLRDIYRLQLHLSICRVPVALPLAAENGEPFMITDGKRVQVSPFIEAEPFAGKVSHVHASGAMLRRFHDALSDRRHTVSLEPQTTFFRPFSYCREALEELGKWDKISRFGLSETIAYAERIYDQWAMTESRLPVTIVHGDWHFWNQLYDGERVRCVLDLDYMKHGPRILDIAYAMWIIHIILPNRAEVFRTAFLESYGELSEEEIAILPWATAKVSLFFLCHAASSHNPPAKWNKQYANQMPFIRWLLSEDGAACLRKAMKGERQGSGHLY